MYTIYGISNCDTMKKAFTWLKAHHIAYEFHDYKKSGISKAKLNEWCKQKGWEAILNKKSSTWRQVDDAQKATISNQKNAISLLQEYTSMIKRPVLEKEGKIVAIGFDEAHFDRIFNGKYS